MPAQPRHRTTASFRLLGRIGLLGLLAALSAVAGCELTGASDPAADVIAAEGAAAEPPTIGGVRRYLITVTRNAPSAEVEAFFKNQIMPSLQSDWHVGDVTTFSDEESSTFAVQFDLKTEDLPSKSLAVDILSIGRGPDEAERLISEAAKYFDLGSARQYVIVRDLSISRSVMGTVEKDKGR